MGEEESVMPGMDEGAAGRAQDWGRGARGTSEERRGREGDELKARQEL